MSTISIDTIEDLSASESVDAAYVVHGTAKAWVNYNQQTPVVNDSLNTSSVTDNTTSDYTINLTSSMGNVLYSAAGMSGSASGGGADMQVPGGSWSTSACQIESYVYNASQVDLTYNGTHLMGDLA